VESATSADILAQAIFHTLVASLLVEALVRSWRVTHPGQRMALRLTALGYPLVLFPALLLLFPDRAGEAFQERWALFVGRRWGDLRFLGADLFSIWLAIFAGLGALLFLMDLAPLVRTRWRGRSSRASSPSLDYARPAAGPRSGRTD
jgi:branched-subunit amino acid ABC-type transport system permease component